MRCNRIGEPARIADPFERRLDLRHTRITSLYCIPKWMDNETRFGCQDQVRHIRSRLFVVNFDIGVRLADEVFDRDAPMDLGQRLPSAVGQPV